MSNFEKIEIERKWILRRDPRYIEPCDVCFTISQKYCDDGWRYRAQSNLSIETDRQTHYSKTRKTPIGLGSNVEVEETISAEEYLSVGDGNRSINKTRSIYNRNGLKFEIDCFSDVHLIIMEVELDSIDQEIEIPEFLQDLIIYEVTGIDQFSNSSLSR